jgi:prepilin-type N-terminal cleavage/methylation domain-containing protein
MACKQTRFARGMTFIEVLIATVVISVAATGALSYGYHGARQRHMARGQSTSTRVAYFVLEDWKGNGGSIFYAKAVSGTPNPLKLDMGFEYIEDIYEMDEVTRMLSIKCVYELTVDAVLMRVTLSRPVDYLRLIPLTITVQWSNDVGNETVQDDAPSIVLTTNVRIDQVGG